MKNTFSFFKVKKGKSLMTEISNSKYSFDLKWDVAGGL